MNRAVDGLVSVVMLVRDRPDYTRQALDSLAACRGELEFVLVDNGSGPETVALLEAFRDNRRHPVEVLRFSDDTGGSSRRNAGAAAARGEYLFFVDNDVVADDPGVAQALVEALLHDPGFGAVSPLLLYPGEAGLVQCAGGGSTADGRIGLLGRGETLDVRHRVSREQTWAPTAALLIRRASFERAGGFDEAFDPVPLCEDVDLCCRLRAAGEGVGYVGCASLRHYEGMTFDHVGYDKLPIWKRHVRVLRARWGSVFSSGPAHDAAELAWRPVVKDYSDPARPHVRLLPAGEVVSTDASFFWSDEALARARSVPDVRVGVAGCGQAALRGALPALGASQRRADAPAAAPFLDFGPVQGVRVTGVADPDLANLVAAARWYEVPHAVRHAVALLDTVPMEGVVVCAPPEWHGRLTLETLRRELPVLVEKPAASTDEELDALLSAVRASPGLHIAVNLPWAHHPGLEALRALVNSGAAGVPQSFTVIFEHSGPKAWAPRASWYQRSPGGVITDLGLHVLDAVERATGAPVTLLHRGSAEPPGMPPVRAQAEVTAGGCSGTVEVGWDAPAPRFTVTLTGDEAVLHVSLIPYRTHGQAVEVRGREGREGRRLIDVPFRAPMAGAGPYAEFAAALRGGPPPRTCLDKVASAVRATIGWAAATVAGS